MNMAKQLQDYTGTSTDPTFEGFNAFRVEGGFRYIDMNDKEVTGATAKEVVEVMKNRTHNPSVTNSTYMHEVRHRTWQWCKRMIWYATEEDFIKELVKVGVLREISES